MDYLNPRKEKRQNTILFIGYGCIAIAVALTTLVLVYQAYGFGLAKEGAVTQSGLTFFSSQPNPATITLNGAVNKSRTNARLTLPEGTYTAQIDRAGYLPWRRTIQVNGGSVHHYDYPFLIPKQLTPKKLASFTKAPALSSQSLDKRWLIVQQTTNIASFDVYDLKTPAKPPTTISLPDAIATKATNTESWSHVEWSDDNAHLLLLHTFDSKTEYILLNRPNPEQSINLTNTLTGAYTTVGLINRKFDSYYLYNSGTKALLTATLQSPAAVSILQRVLNYKSYSDDTLLYATDSDAPKGKVLVKLRVPNKTYTVRSLPASSTYPLDLTTYSGDLYVILGAASENKLAIYKNPISQLQHKQDYSLSPAQILHVNNPNFVSFSSSAQFIMAESGTQFAVYDIENDKGYNFTAHQPVDAPAVHATWMDGNRLTYISNGSLIEFDYDYTNQHALVPAGATYLPAFAPDYRFVYTFPGAATGETSLTQTSLLAPADQ